jgi:hypothetical protein
MMTQLGQRKNNKGKIVLPLLAAVGTGAATFYSLRNNQNPAQQSIQQAGQAMQQFSGAGTQQSNQQQQYQ